MGMTWLPYTKPQNCCRALQIIELCSGAMACEQILTNTCQQPELASMWDGWHRQAARYGLMLLKELELREGTLRTKLQILRPFFLEHLTGSVDWVEPEWLTDKICQNHQGMLKTLGIYRALVKRIKKVSSDVAGWLEEKQLPTPIHTLSLDAVEHAHYLLEDEKAPKIRADYSDFKVPPAQGILWPSNS